ncbi:protein tyrosine phosphatase [Sphingobacterium faecium]|uniref:tyrosine-protein phosphatase n=1 Tax=Sphingobacterium faecium TaxID=34087 RepID=UPI0004E5F385|nr:CpsB/CapC family capsule biosynthesis tyrosine phosphatase [Sphingobacterium faecium]UXD69469.1 protein tyrosine phosphatase [Sphingobacterium faecium]CDS93541.1 Protein-tyrosine phosphatase [Sphingobacterium sp. PM2-P1-29]
MTFFSNLFKREKKSTSVRSIIQLEFLEVDMHNHLLPGIDDGSTSVQQSLGFIKELNSLGFKKFICTPHIMDGVHPNTKFSITQSHQALLEGLRKAGSNIEIFPAAEHMIDDGLHTLIQNNDLCLMPGGYVLIEMSYLSESKALFQTILNINKLGYKPILAHPERYNYYHTNFDIYKQIKDAGCLLQLNLLSLSRYYGVDVKAIAMTLVKSGMYDFVGTDLHHEKHLQSLKNVVEKYPVREMLKSCNILNPTLIDHINDQNGNQIIA